MPQQLGDVLHYFLPELAPARRPEVRRVRGRLVAVPMGQEDVVRAALVWNLAVELARQGGRTALVTPADGDSAPLWPEAGRGPLGLEHRQLPAAGPSVLAREVDGLLQGEDPVAGDAAFLLLPLPTVWLEAFARESNRAQSLLVLARPGEHELLEAYAALKRASLAWPRARLGVSVYGVRSIAEATRTFDLLAAAAESHLGCRLVSYGLLVDDLHLCRSIVTRRPVALSHPRCPAARALADVARLLLEDAERAPDD